MWVCANGLPLMLNRSCISLHKSPGCSELHRFYHLCNWEQPLLLGYCGAIFRITLATEMLFGLYVFLYFENYIKIYKRGFILLYKNFTRKEVLL